MYINYNTVFKKYIFNIYLSLMFVRLLFKIYFPNKKEEK